MSNFLSTNTMIALWDVPSLSILLYTIFCALLFASYYHLTRHFKHFEKKGIPYKKPLFLFGNVKDRLTLKKSFHELHKDFYFFFKGNPYYGIFEGSSPLLYIADPALIRNILVKDFDYFVDRPTTTFKSLSPYIDKFLISLKGKEWKQVRSAVTPAFSSGRLKAMVEIENICGVQLSKFIEEKIEENGVEGVILDMKETLGKFTLDTTASTAFGVELNSNSDPNSEVATKISQFNDIPQISRFILILTLFLQPPKFITSMIPVAFLNVDTVKYLANLIKEVSLKRKDLKFRRNDFLQLMIDAQAAPISEDNTSPTTMDKNEKDVLLSEEIAIAQAIIFFIAGYETTATALTMLCYELAKNPEIQAKIRNEVLNKLKERNEEITYELINELPYLDMAISETLRMYPPVGRIDRLCMKKYLMQNIEIYPGDKIGISVYGIHNDPEYYPQPEVFRPERFSQAEKEQRHPLVYLPFGAGPRNCIGLRAAQLGIKICMAHLLKDYTFETCSKTKIPFEFHKASFLLKAKDGVFLKINKLK